jgi:hypothetical protein
VGRALIGELNECSNSLDPRDAYWIAAFRGQGAGVQWLASTGSA